MKVGNEDICKFMNNLNIILVRIESDQKVSLINKKGCDILECSEEEIIGKNWFVNFIPEDQRTEVLKVFERIMAGDILPVENYENRILTARGREKIISWHNAYIENEEGKLVATFSAGVDVTEQRNAERELSESEARLALALDLTGAGVVEFDVDTGDDIYFNDQWLELLGYTMEKHPPVASILREWPRRVHPKNREEVKESFRKFFRGYSPVFKSDCRLAMDDGTWKYFEIMARAIRRHASGLASRITAVIRDTTEQHLRLEELEERREKLSRALEASGAGVWELDVESGKLDIDERSREMLEIKDGEIPTSALDLPFPEEERNRISSLVKDFVEGRRDAHDEPFRILTEDGEPKWLHVWAMVSRRAQDGKPLTIHGAIINLTERNALTREKEKLEKQLHQAGKMEAIGTLASGIAHDFNNILGVIIGYTDLLSMNLKGNRKALRDLEGIMQAGNRAKELINRILAFSKDNKDHEASLKPILLDKLLLEVTTLLEPSIPSSIQLKTDIMTDVGILGNDTELHEVIMNLCTNALQAMKGGNGTLKITLGKVKLGADKPEGCERLTEGGYAELKVKDTGSGIPKEIMDRIFEPYFTTKSEEEGTGLGLSVVLGILEKHGGGINVKSKPGEGAEFSIYLPLIERKMDQPGKEKEKEAVSGKERILLVDDEEILVDVCTRMLTKMGYQVIGTTNSVEALEMFEEDPNRFDLVLSDMTMPVLPGDELARKIMTVKPEMPVILFTGFTERINREEAVKLGVRDLILKPISMKDLGNAVRKVLDDETAPEPS